MKWFFVVLIFAFFFFSAFGARADQPCWVDVCKRSKTGFPLKGCFAKKIKTGFIELPKGYFVATGCLDSKKAVEWTRN